MFAHSKSLLSFLVFFLMVFLLWTSCSKKSTEPEQSQEESTTIADFPNHAGDYWIYAVVDSFSETNVQMDTVKVSVEDSIMMANNEKAMVWVYTYRSRVDTQYVLVHADTVFFLTEPNRIYLNTFFIFPLTVGNRWGRPIDSLQVVEQKTVTTPAGIFPDCFRIHRHSEQPNHLFDGDIWFANGKGMVRLDYMVMEFGPPVYSTWELLSYHVKE